MTHKFPDSLSHNRPIVILLECKKLVHRIFSLSPLCLFSLKDCLAEKQLELPSSRLLEMVQLGWIPNQHQKHILRSPHPYSLHVFPDQLELIGSEGS